MCKNNLKSSDNVKSFPPNFIILFFPFLTYDLLIKYYINLDITGIKIASILSPIFSIKQDQPFSIESSISLIIFLDPNLTHFSELFFSFSLIQVIPYNYGSIISGYLSVFVKIVPIINYYK